MYGTPRRSPAVSAHARRVLEKLGNAVQGIARPFVCSGSLVPDAPVALGFDGGEAVFENRPGAAEDAGLKALLSRCRAAPFGKGSKTLFDRNVRECLELKAGGFSVRGFDPAESGVLDEIKEQLCPEDPGPLVAELYGLNVYGARGHFAPHKDTPRGEDMLGTLVVCLPSWFYGGQLVVGHGGARKVFNWAQDMLRAEPSRLYWAAFFGDVDHSIEEVVAGRRITLAYVLRRGEGACPAPLPAGTIPERLQAAFEEAVTDRQFFGRGATLGFPCFHMYGKQAAFQESRERALTPDTLRRLKGRDRDVAAAAMRAGLSVTIEPYLVETCADERWRLEKFPSKYILEDRVTPSDIEDAFSITAHSQDDEELGVTWVLAPPGRNVPLGRKSNMQSDYGGPCAELFHSCEYSGTGYFGNEGSESDFYLYAALHVVVPAFGQPPRTKSRSADGKDARGGKRTKRRTKA
jgi:hypothetical protein